MRMKYLISILMISSRFIVSSGNIIYGTIWSDGTSDNGIIYKIDTTGKGIFYSLISIYPISLYPL